jgi:type II secretion system protein N
MNLRRLVLVGSTVCCGLLLLLMLTLLFLPSRELVGVVQRAIARQGLTLTVGSVGKVVPLGIVARQVVLGSPQGEIVTIDRLVCRVHLLPLLLGRLQWRADATLGTGSLSLVGTLGKQQRLQVSSSNVRLERLPLLKTALGGSVQGAVAVQGTLLGAGPAAKGTLTLDATAVDLREVSLGGMRLPDAVYRSMRGALAVAGGTVALQSIALEGDGVYARLKGSFPVMAPFTAAPLNLTLELMPRAEFMERQKLIFLLLTRFMVSPGNFQIPIRGTLGAPSVF